VQEAVGQIEQATQQNAALVEETTAALGSADNQVRGVTEVISFFQVDAREVPVPANAPTAKQPKPGPAKPVAEARTKPKLAATGTDDGWEEF
jgi:methyl-accepting chemotaxis protein